MIELPDGWFYEEDISFYRNSYSCLPDNATTLEVGCWKGRSICSIADIVKQKNITIYAIDNFLGSENERTTFCAEAATTDIEKIFKDNIASFDIENNVKILKVDSREVWEKFSMPDETFDFIFIDGQHTADLVESDIRTCLPKLKQGCVIAGHDLILSEVKTGVEAVFGDCFEEQNNIWKKTKIGVIMSKGIILISAWSKPLRDGRWNAKNPSKEWWTKTTKLLKDEGFDVWQCGQGPEIKLKFIDRHLWDKDLWALGEDIKTCSTWISVDNFFQHFAWLQFKKPGIVIWSQSDPEVFGHVNNINLLKDKKHLREKQYEMWEAATYNREAFVEPEEIVKTVKELLENTINRGEDERQNTETDRSLQK